MERQSWETCRYAFVSKGNIEKSLYKIISNQDLRGICEQIAETAGSKNREKIVGSKNREKIVEELQKRFGMIEIYGCENPKVIALNIYDLFKLEKEGKSVARIGYLNIDRSALCSSGLANAERISKRLSLCMKCKFYEERQA